MKGEDEWRRELTEYRGARGERQKMMTTSIRDSKQTGVGRRRESAENTRIQKREKS